MKIPKVLFQGDFWWVLKIIFNILQFKNTSVYVSLLIFCKSLNSDSLFSIGQSSLLLPQTNRIHCLKIEMKNNVSSDKNYKKYETNRIINTITSCANFNFLFRFSVWGRHSVLTSDYSLYHFSSETRIF